MMMTDKRMTWREIQETYPDQWVGLTDVVYVNDDGISIMPKGELTRKMLDGEFEAVYTTPDNKFQLGMVGVFG